MKVNYRSKTNNSISPHILKKIKFLKHQPFRKVFINGKINNQNFKLQLITEEVMNNKAIISLLSKWRKKNEKWFQSQFPISDAKTKVWLKRRVIDEKDRLLFLIEIDNIFIGHVGLYRFNEFGLCQIDNILRGNKIFPGLMHIALEKMMNWGKKELNINYFSLQTFSDNVSALKFYSKMNFYEFKRRPLIYIVNSYGGEWISAPRNYSKPIKRYEIYMQQLPKIKPSIKKISFAGPSITKKEIQYVADGVRHGFYETYDKHIKQLEKTVANYIGVKYALAGFCATHSLHLACLVCGFNKNDEVICTDFSWAATAHTIAYTGAKPVFVDIDPNTWCISPMAIEKAITKKTKAIMLVHSYGYPAQMDKIIQLANKYKLRVIEDAAPALGSKFHNKYVGSFGDVGCFSFHGAKIAASGEGGILVTNNEDMYKKAILLSNMGRTNRLHNFWCDSIGYEYQISNVTAALALAQVERIEELVHKKRQIFSWYYKRLCQVKQLKLIREARGVFCNYAYPAALLISNKITRDNLIKYLRLYNIHGREAFPRMSQFPMYEDRYSNPNAQLVEKFGFNLPSAQNMTEKDVDYTCKIIKSIIDR